MWRPQNSGYIFYYAKHPAYTMRHHWLECFRLTTFVYLKFGKLLKHKDHASLAKKMIDNSRQVKQSIIDAFKAQTYEQANEALERMLKAKNNCFGGHFEAEQQGLYTNYDDAYKILKPIVDMGYYKMFLKDFFKRKFHPPKAHARLHHHYQVRRLLNYPPR